MRRKVRSAPVALFAIVAVVVGMGLMHVPSALILAGLLLLLFAFGLRETGPAAERREAAPQTRIAGPLDTMLRESFYRDFGDALTAFLVGAFTVLRPELSQAAQAALLDGRGKLRLLIEAWPLRADALVQIEEPPQTITLFGFNTTSHGPAPGAKQTLQ